MNFMVVTAIFWAMLASPYLIQYENIDPNLMGYYKDYVELYRKSCPKKSNILPTRITILFEPSPGNPFDIAYCARMGRTARISVNVDSWISYKSIKEREQILYHELSHCMIKKFHNIDDENNYMFPRLETILEHDVLVKQVEKDIKESCNEK